jgi:HK97 family phage prohead protease
MTIMGSEFTRTFTPLLEVRSAAKGGDGRTVEGIAVPYGYKQHIDHTLTEQFAAGAFNHQLNAAFRVPFSRDHMSQGGVLIGRALELRDDAMGLWGRWRVSATQSGDETLALIADGVLSELSVGFRERENRREPDGTITRVRADLREVSVVLAGAYGEHASVLAVRDAADQQDHVRPEQRRIDQVRKILADLPELPLLDDDSATSASETG